VFAVQGSLGSRRCVMHRIHETQAADGRELRDALPFGSDDRATMRACVIRATGGLDRIEIADVPAPGSPALLGTREVRVDVRAAALNRLDLFVVRGLPGEHHFPHVLGSDGAGVVKTVGPDVTAVQPGDAVMINPAIWDGTCEFCRAGEHSLCVNYQVLGEHLPGTLAESVMVPEDNVVRIPPSDPPLTWAEAAAFPLVSLTAWRMVVTRARVRPDETVLVWGIGGGVALTALRIAKLQGARVIATSSSDMKLAQAQQLGADVTINHRTQSVPHEVRALTGRRGVDVVIETVGEATWEDSLRCLAKGGRLVTCGATTGPHVVTDVRRLFWNQYSILGSTLGNAAEFADVVRVLGSGALRPLVDQVYPVREVRAAFERLANGEQLGKLVVEMWDGVGETTAT
jgi:NADPH:quinone reductase-like Zn-dependent oxidoreductase